MNQFTTSLYFSIKEQLTNKFAFGLLVVFVPLWYWLLGLITDNSTLEFRLRSVSSLVKINGHDLTLITAGMNVLTMILGFMFFHATRQSLPFDGRLTKAGLSRTKFLLAKVLTMVITTGVVALYTVLVMICFWRFPNNIATVWLAFWLVSLMYAGLGFLLGLIVNNELVGFFVLIMVSMIDTFLQNPLGNPAANKDFLAYLPSYAPMQLAVQGGFLHRLPFGLVGLGALWIGGILLLSLLMFAFRTRRKSSVVEV